MMIYPSQRPQCSFVALLLILASVPTSHTKSHAHSEEEREYIKKITSSTLKEAIKALRRRKKLKPAITPQRLIQIAMHEPNAPFTFLFPYLKTLLKKNGYSLGAKAHHELMKYAILRNISIPIIEYLLEHKVFDPKHMKGNVRYSIVSKLPPPRILVIDILTKQLLPEKIHFLVSIPSRVSLLLRVIQWIMGVTIISKRHIWMTSVGISALFLELFINALVVACCAFYRMGIEPNYLMLALLSKRTRDDKEKLAFLLLPHTPNVNAESLIITPIALQSKDRKIIELHEIYAPSHYHYIPSALHLAAQYDLLRLVKALIRRGAHFNTHAVYMKDRIEKTKKTQKIKLITLTQLYRRKAEEAVYKLPLHLAPPKSKTYKYLAKKTSKRTDRKKHKQ